MWQVLQARCHYEFRAKQTKLLIAKGAAPAAPASSSSDRPPTIMVSEKVSHALLIRVAGAWPSLTWPCLAWPCLAVLHGHVEGVRDGHGVVASCMAMCVRWVLAACMSLATVARACRQSWRQSYQCVPCARWCTRESSPVQSVVSEYFEYCELMHRAGAWMTIGACPILSCASIDPGAPMRMSRMTRCACTRWRRRGRTTFRSSRWRRLSGAWRSSSSLLPTSI